MTASSKNALNEQVTVVVVHYQTPELLLQTIDSFRSFYSDVPLLIFDNGSSAASEDVLSYYEKDERTGNHIARKSPRETSRKTDRKTAIETEREMHTKHNVTRVHREPENLFHGPAMHKSVSELVYTPYCFFLDSDTQTEKHGFLEETIRLLEEDPRNYAAGRQILANRRGFKDEQGFPILLTPYLMIKRTEYHRFPPFIHHGQPGLQHFFEAQKAGFRLIDYPMHEYIHHLWRGTASKYGYRLGWRGKWDYLMNKIGRV